MTGLIFFVLPENGRLLRLPSEKDILLDGLLFNNFLCRFMKTEDKMSALMSKNKKFIVGGLILLFLVMASCMTIASIFSFIFAEEPQGATSSDRSRDDDDDEYFSQGNSYNQSNLDEVHSLDCTGYFSNIDAAIEGERVYSPYNALGDGYITFRGVLIANGWEYPMEYEGYTNTAPYEGFIQESQDQWLKIAVLDNTAGNFIIYDGQPSLYAPDIWGEFDCRWN